MTFMRSRERKMREAIKVALVTGVIVFCENLSAQPAESYTAKGIIAQYCIKCHRAPGFSAETPNSEIGAPDFQTIADNQKTYTRERLTTFLRQPHFPMQQFTLSESDIQRLISFVEGLRAKEEVVQ